MGCVLPRRPLHTLCSHLSWGWPCLPMGAVHTWASHLPTNGAGRHLATWPRHHPGQQRTLTPCQRSLSSPESSENSTSNHLTSTKDIEVDIEVIIPVAFVPLCQVSITTGRSYFDSGVTVRKKAQVGPKQLPSGLDYLRVYAIYIFSAKQVPSDYSAKQFHHQCLVI